MLGLDRWIVEGGDIREVPSIKQEVGDFFKKHGARKTIAHDRIAGCAHEEGIDHPLGRKCPRCPFWHDIDRLTHEPIKPPVATRSVEQVLEALSADSDLQPLAALESADAHREALVPKFLEVCRRTFDDPSGAAEEELNLFAYALYLFAKWRETQAYPTVIRWLSLSDRTCSEISGDMHTHDGGRILAAVFDGELEPIKQLILNRDADEYCRGVALEAFALLGAWAEIPQTTVSDYVIWLAEEGLEREPSFVWSNLAVVGADFEILPAFPALRRAFDERLIDQTVIGVEELKPVESGPRGQLLEEQRDRRPPVSDVAEATKWWGRFSKTRKAAELAAYGVAHQPHVAAPKIGRNDPCPCGSGRKFKKCCGK